MYVLTSVEGLHLSCDFVVHSAALFGNPPDYAPTRTLANDVYDEPYEHLGTIPFSDYGLFASVSAMDTMTVQTVANVPYHSFKDFTCLAFKVSTDIGDIRPAGTSEENDRLLSSLLAQGERIVDLIRLFLFKPGNNTSIGRVGAIGNGVSGVWIGDDGEHAKFISRQTSAYQFVQPPMQVSLTDVRRIYNHEVYKELCSAACASIKDPDPILARVFDGLRALRESRTMQNPESRFLRLASLAEHLAKKDSTEHYRGCDLRDRIAKIASSGWDGNDEVASITTDLWDNVRNPLTHSVDTFASIGRDASSAITQLERLVIDMLQAIVLAWKYEEFVGDPYAYLLSR